MHENSLFAVLLRSGWWWSALIAVGIVVLLRIWLPLEFAVFAAAPFAVIAAYVAWQALRAPSEGRIARTMERLQAMSWEDFSAAVEAAYRREGYAVSRLGDARADFELVQGARHTLVACKRWKATQTGIEPLRELHAARQKREAHAGVYIATGKVSDEALAYAKDKYVTVLQGAELVKLLPG